MPIIPAALEAEAGELLGPRRQRLQRAETTPLHSRLGQRARLHHNRKRKGEGEAEGKAKGDQGDEGKRPALPGPAHEGNSPRPRGSGPERKEGACAPAGAGGLSSPPSGPGRAFRLLLISRRLRVSGTGGCGAQPRRAGRSGPARTSPPPPQNLPRARDVPAAPRGGRALGVPGG